MPTNQPANTKALLKTALQKININTNQPFKLYLRAFKHEEQLEVWLQQGINEKYQLWKYYDFCQNSGTLGPKRREGDKQIPEGYYHINRFNPKSKFHLSLGLNYPNPSDKILSNPTHPGSDIFIHGGCLTIGCIPITNEWIEELYLLAEIAKANGQTRIPVNIFPFKMTETNLQSFAQKMPQHKAFWESIEGGYTYFEKNRELPIVKFLENGGYDFE